MKRQNPEKPPEAVIPDVKDHPMTEKLKRKQTPLKNPIPSPRKTAVHPVNPPNLTQRSPLAPSHRLARAVQSITVNPRMNPKQSPGRGHGKMKVLPLRQGRKMEEYLQFHNRIKVLEEFPKSKGPMSRMIIWRRTKRGAIRDQVEVAKFLLFLRKSLDPFS